jgi:hypothetical protein
MSYSQTIGILYWLNLPCLLKSSWLSKAQHQAFAGDGWAVITDPTLGIRFRSCRSCSEVDRVLFPHFVLLVSVVLIFFRQVLLGGAWNFHS